MRRSIEKNREYSRHYYQKNRLRILSSNKRSRLKNLSKYRGHQKKYRDRIRLQVLQYYSQVPPQCACCKENELQFLAIDHVSGGGNKHRKAVRAQNIYFWLIKNKYPRGFQVLCHNCNLAKGYYGQCPHINQKTIKL